MPVYDCGDPECHECQREFGPDRSRAIANYKAREAAYEKLNCVPAKSPIELLEEIVGHLGAAISQTIDSDDKIIADHVRAAYKVALELYQANRRAA